MTLYDKGGWVPGPKSAAQVVTIHGGEDVLPLSPCANCGHSAAAHDNMPTSDPGWTDLDMWPCNRCDCDHYDEAIS